jgi:MOSC domain-containing protein YiiM
MNNGRIKAISISEKKGIVKTNVDNAELIQNHGIKGDAHAGDWHRQISLLAFESIQKIIDKGLPGIVPGIFAENITTEGFDLLSLNIGDKLTIGESILLEITQIGKECHTRCAIYQQAGDCVMPREGYFAKVLNGGSIKVGDEIIKVKE